MQTVRAVELSCDIKQAVLIPPDALLYPNDRQAQFEGRQFGGRPIRDSVHYRTCEQLRRNGPLESLPYYRWTMEKLARYGSEFENLLCHASKGCGVPETQLESIRAMPLPERHQALASSASTAFRNLYESIMAGWSPDRASSRDIVLFRLPGGKFTIFEGRHRLAILAYRLDEVETGAALMIDQGSIRDDYYRWRLRGLLRRKLRQVTGR